MKSADLVDAIPKLTWRKLDYWCYHGIFGTDKCHPGSGKSRTFTGPDIRVARVLAEVAAGFDELSKGRGGFIAIYHEIADRVRNGETQITMQLIPGMRLTVDVNETLRDGT